jgi:hypothetical protein
MTKLLEEAIEAVRKLPPERQDTIGAIILEELLDEERWAHQFAQTPELLEKLALEAREDVRAGRATPLEFPPRR